MGVPNYECVTIVNLGRQGWQEKLYLPATDPTTALATLLNLANARLDMLNPLAQIDAVKVSDVAIIGDSLPDYTMASKRSAFTAALTRDQATTSLLCRAFSKVNAAGGGSLQYQRSIELTGIPDEWTNYDPVTGAGLIPGTAKCPAGFTARFNAWVTKLIALGFCIKALDKNQPSKPIKGIGVNPNTSTVTSLGKLMVWCPGHGMTSTNSENKQTSYRIKGVKFLPNAGDMKGLGPLDSHGKSLVNRVQMWQDITTLLGAYPTVLGQVTNPTDWLQLAYDLPVGWTGLPLTYVGGGNVQQRVPIYTPITSILPERFASRDRGRAYFVPRGRARKRVC